MSPRAPSLVAALAALAAVGALAACEADPRPLVLPPPAAAASPIRGLERLDREGLYVAGAAERFRLVHDAGDAVKVRWSPDGGSFVPIGDELTWVLPAADRARLRVELLDGDEVVGEAAYTFAVAPAPSAPGAPPGVVALPVAAVTAPAGPIDPDGDDATGAACDLAMGSGDAAHVIYTNDTHFQLWYALWTGSGWSHELVDGPGFDTGALVVGSIDLALDSTGKPHVAYQYLNGDVRYAVRSGGKWTRELVSGIFPPASDTAIALALDPSAGQRPTVAYSRYDYDNAVVAFRTGAGAWDADVQQSNDYDSDFTGGLAFASNGTAYVSWNTDDRNVATWTAAGGFGASTLVYDDGSDSVASRLVLDAAQKPLFLHLRGLEHLVGSTWKHSDVEYGGTTWQDIAFGTKPVILLRHGSQLELVQPNADGFWTYAVVDDVDSAPIRVALDAAGTPHGCYRKGSRVQFW